MEESMWASRAYVILESNRMFGISFFLQAGESEQKQLLKQQIFML